MTNHSNRNFLPPSSRRPRTTGSPGTQNLHCKNCFSTFCFKPFANAVPTLQEMFLNVSQTQTAENLADGTSCSETHADASSVAGNWRLLSDDEKKRRRKLSYAKRDHSRVNLLGSFQRWRGLRKKLNMSSDKELADFLMDHYESTQKPSR